MRDFSGLDRFMGGGFAYVATPYTKYEAGTDMAWNDACVAMAALLKMNVPAFSPIVHCHPVAHIGRLDALDQKAWMRLNARFLGAASALVVVRMPGWDESSGVEEEINHFLSARKPIFHLAWPSADHLIGVYPGKD